jgi:hypothetical protein
LVYAVSRRAWREGRTAYEDTPKELALVERKIKAIKAKDSEMTEENKQELKPCPCCKSDYVGRVRNEKVFIGQVYSGRYPAVVARQNHGFQNKCHKCGLATCWWHYQAEADEAWNTRVELAVKPLLEATPLLNQSHMDELAQANTIIHLETEVARLKAQIHRMQNEEIDCMHDICAEREIAQNQCDEYKRLLGVANDTLKTISKGNTNAQFLAKQALAETGGKDESK